MEFDTKSELGLDIDYITNKKQISFLNVKAGNCR